MFAFYRENHVNPFGGLSALLPLLIQIPILIALSTVFRFEAAHAHLAAHFLFVPNLNDDPNSHLLAPFLPTPAYLVLPVAAAIASYFQAHLSVLRPGANAGKVEQVTHLTQRLTGLLLPVIIYTVAIVTPSGLGLYWLVGNCVAIAQQLIFPPKLHTPVE
jgi:YidC/Oxa1 family membrane protein insertase